MSRSWQRVGTRAAKLALILVMVVLIGLLAGRSQDVAALSLTGWGNRGRPMPSPGARTAKGLQEVAPPPAAQQLRQALVSRKPLVSIETPAAGSLLPEGPWILRLRAEDWPLVDAGSLGLGPHLVVQLDDESPRRLTTTEMTMPPLAPGSHRLTVYAAWPWGEAVKDPGAWRQIRIHRVAANPLSLPAQGSPQLLGVSPWEPSAAEPVLVDWLLIDTPLQNLRAGDASWRLRITVNGVSFLVDRQTPLWLKGWRVGSNALQLELVDPRGEPLNPPFNSLVREVRLAADAFRPPWLGSQLTASELARLVGEAPPEPELELGTVSGEPEQEVAAPDVGRLLPSGLPTGPGLILDQQEEASPEPDSSGPGRSDQDAMGTDQSEAEAEVTAEPTADGIPSERSEAPPPPPDPAQTRDAAAQAGPLPELSLETELTRESREPQQPAEPPEPVRIRPPEASGQPGLPQKRSQERETAPAGPPPAPAGEFETSKTPLGSPRNGLNDDATVIRSESPGPLARLLRRLGR